MTPESTHPILSPPPLAKTGKVMTADEAIRLIRDGDTVATGGFVTIGFPEDLATHLEKFFLATGQPRDLTLVYAAGQGDRGHRGLNHFGHEGLVRRVIGGHWGLVPKLQKLAIDNKIEAYNFPQGVLTHLFRDTAAHKPGTLTTIGLDTFVDPRLGGGKLNERTTTDLVQLLTIDGQEYLFYKALPIQVALLRGTTADVDGNITMEKEALTLEVLALATVAHNSGGLVIVQVERIAQQGTLKPKEVKIPGVLVDAVVVADPKHHWQTFAEVYNPGFSGELVIPTQSIPPMTMDARKIIARRAALELRPHNVVNLGIGMPEGVASVVYEEQLMDLITLTAEPGIIGGIPAGGLNFGAATNPQAIIDQPAQFDYYDGGGLDVTCLGLAQADRHGNVNVSKFGRTLAGAGGFINISQSAKKVLFLGTFTIRSQVVIEAQELHVHHDSGKVHKFIEEVEHRTFSGAYATRKGQTVLYITERCVFQLTKAGLELIEIAPGIDLEPHILALMEFRPLLKRPLRLMDKRIFSPEPMGLKGDLVSLPMEARFTYDAQRELGFINLEWYVVRTPADIEAIAKAVRTLLAPLHKKVSVIVNYDNFVLFPEMKEVYIDMVKNLADKYFSRLTRYTTSTFLRMKG